MTPQLLQIAACVCFGVATTLMMLSLYRLQASAQLLGAEVEVVSARRAEIRSRALRKSLLFRLALPLLQGIGSVIARMDVGALRSYVSIPYRRAGYPGGLEDDEVLALALLVGIGVVIFAGFSLVVLAGILWGVLGVLLLPMGLLIVVSSLKTRAEERQRLITNALPYVLDLLVLILRSGASLNIALRRVVNDYAEHPVGDELGQVMAEMDVGAPRAQAFRQFAQRVGMEDVTALADSIVQSEELGWPLAQSLEKLADRLNSERLLRAQATAGAAGVYVMLPSTLVLMAAVLLLFGPFIVKGLRGGFSLQ